MEVIINVPMKPLSTNRKYMSQGGRVIKSGQARKYEAELVEYFADYGSEIINFGIQYSGMYADYGIKVEMTVYLKDMFKKDGRLSKTSLDIDNCLKTTTDVLFNYMGINDGLITSCIVKKRPSIGIHDHFTLHLSLDPL